MALTRTVTVRNADELEILATALERAAATRVTAARQAAGELAADPDVTDRRPGAVKIAATLAEADVLDQAAAALRADEPAPPPARRRRSRKAPATDDGPAAPTADALANARAQAEAAIAAELAAHPEPPIDPETGLPAAADDEAATPLEELAADPAADDLETGATAEDEPDADEADDGATVLAEGLEADPEADA